MHTTGLRSDDFRVTLDGRPGTLTDVFPGFDERDRLGIVVAADGAAAGAATLVLAAVTAFYDRLRAQSGGDGFFAYPDFYAFHVTRARGTLRKLDVFPEHKEVVVPADLDAIVEAVNDRAVTRLLVPDAQRPQAEPGLRAETAASASRTIRTALAYAPTGQVTAADITIRGSAASQAFVVAMAHANGAPPVPADPPAEAHRRLELAEALALLAAAARVT